jgi:hypothetical protein
MGKTGLRPVAQLRLAIFIPLERQMLPALLGQSVEPK